MNPFEIDQFARNLAGEIHEITGHLTDREARHLAMLAFLTKDEGELLEIGSFMGKSTVLLSMAAGKATGNPRIVAVDPLTQPAKTDPDVAGNQPSRDHFFANLKKAGVETEVEFYEMLSCELAKTWVKPLRMLWIDGDHTYKGVLSDFENFAPHLIPGGIIAMHDMMHGFRGPDQVFIQNILLSNQFGVAGIVGSIGWAQKGTPTVRQKTKNGQLAEKLQAWVNACPETTPHSSVRKIWLKIKRAQVPHFAMSMADLQTLLNEGITSEIKESI